MATDKETQKETQAVNDVIVAAVKKATGTSSRLTMTASNESFAQGLFIYRGPFKNHHVSAKIRDIDTLIEIVKAFDAAWNMGHTAGVASNQATMRDALGISVDDDGKMYIPD